MMYFVGMGNDLVVDIQDAGVAVLTLNRPEHLNAYTADMGASLSRAYRECDEDDDVRVIVVTTHRRSMPRPATLRSPHRPLIRPPSNSTSR
jgi:1,4-dihydroxy-2-naphthoyl-CoA synthase